MFTTHCRCVCCNVTSSTLCPVESLLHSACSCCRAVALRADSTLYPGADVYVQGVTTSLGKCESLMTVLQQSNVHDCVAAAQAVEEAINELDEHRGVCGRSKG